MKKSIAYVFFNIDYHYFTALNLHFINNENNKL